jgi:hypothetical protein
MHNNTARQLRYLCCYAVNPKKNNSMLIVKRIATAAIWKRNGGKDITLNVSLKDLLIRFGLTVFIPIVAMLIDAHLVIYTTPIIVYLFITMLTRFCFIKYLWHHYVLNQRIPLAKAYGKDPDYPEETI